MDQQLILLPTTQLLEKFGAGKHVPGSGSAAAFSGILACKLSLTVIKLTKEKENYAAVEPQMSFIETQIVNVLQPALFDAFQKDSDEFDKVITIRLQRDKETNARKRKQLANHARELLRPATEVPIQICELCQSVCQHALSLFNFGFQSARGDSGTAATLALAGANGALFTCYLNLKEFRSGDWAKETRRRCDVLLQRSSDLQKHLFSMVARLQEEGIEPTAIQLELKMD